MILYHSTSPEAAATILETGFRDSTGTFLTTEQHSGLWVANRPVDENEGAKGSTVLRIDLDLSAEDLDEYEWVNEWDQEAIDEPGAAMAYREWLIPAAILNARGKIERMSEVDL